MKLHDTLNFSDKKLSSVKKYWRKFLIKNFTISTIFVLWGLYLFFAVFGNISMFIYSKDPSRMLGLLASFPSFAILYNVMSSSTEEDHCNMKRKKFRNFLKFRMFFFKAFFMRKIIVKKETISKIDELLSEIPSFRYFTFDDIKLYNDDNFYLSESSDFVICFISGKGNLMYFKLKYC